MPMSVRSGLWIAALAIAGPASTALAVQEEGGEVGALEDKQKRPYCENRLDRLTDLGGGKFQYKVSYFYPGDPAKAIYAADVSERLLVAPNDYRVGKPGITMRYEWLIDLSKDSFGGYPRVVSAISGTFRDPPGPADGVPGPPAAVRIGVEIAGVKASMTTDPEGREFGWLNGDVAAPGFGDPGATRGSEAQMKAFEVGFRATPISYVVVTRSGREAVRIPIASAGWQKQRDAAFAFVDRALGTLQRGRCPRLAG